MTENKKARPWDIFNKNLANVDESIFNKRMDICRSCEHLIKLTNQCTKCGCFMNLKTKMPHAVCPIGKWKEERISFKEEK